VVTRATIVATDGAAGKTWAPLPTEGRREALPAIIRLLLAGPSPTGGGPSATGKRPTPGPAAGRI